MLSVIICGGKDHNNKCNRKLKGQEQRGDCKNEDDTCKINGVLEEFVLLYKGDNANLSSDTPSHTIDSGSSRERDIERAFLYLYY